MFTLNNVLHVPTIRKNLVSAALLIKSGYKFVLVSDKAVISKNEMFIGKGYFNEGLFKLNVMVVDSIDKNSTSVYLLELILLKNLLPKTKIEEVQWAEIKIGQEEIQRQLLQLWQGWS